MHFDPNEWPDPFEPDPTVHWILTGLMGCAVLALLYMAFFW